MGVKTRYALSTGLRTFTGPQVVPEMARIYSDLYTRGRVRQPIKTVLASVDGKGWRKVAARLGEVLRPLGVVTLQVSKSHNPGAYYRQITTRR